MFFKWYSIGYAMKHSETMSHFSWIFYHWQDLDRGSWRIHRFLSGTRESGSISKSQPRWPEFQESWSPNWPSKRKKCCIIIIVIVIVIVLLIIIIIIICNWLLLISSFFALFDPWLRNCEPFKCHLCVSPRPLLRPWVSQRYCGTVWAPLGSCERWNDHSAASPACSWKMGVFPQKNQRVDEAHTEKINTNPKNMIYKNHQRMNEKTGYTQWFWL